jgi:hypothetical protein
MTRLPARLVPRATEEDDECSSAEVEHEAAGIGERPSAEKDDPTAGGWRGCWHGECPVVTEDEAAGTGECPSAEEQGPAAGTATAHFEEHPAAGTVCAPVRGRVFKEGRVSGSTLLGGHRGGLGHEI